MSTSIEQLANDFDKKNQTSEQEPEQRSEGESEQEKEYTKLYYSGKYSVLNPVVIIIAFVVLTLLIWIIIIAVQPSHFSSPSAQGDQVDLGKAFLGSIIISFFIIVIVVCVGYIAGL